MGMNCCLVYMSEPMAVIWLPVCLFKFKLLASSSVSAFTQSPTGGQIIQLNGSGLETRKYGRRDLLR
jgi:hypothetical protein